MDKEILEKSAPWICMVAIYVIQLIIQCNLFATPAQLKDVKMEIKDYVSDKYVTKEVGNEIKNQLGSMQYKIDEMYKIITKTIK